MVEHLVADQDIAGLAGAGLGSSSSSGRTACPGCFRRGDCSVCAGRCTGSERIVGQRAPLRGDTPLFGREDAGQPHRCARMAVEPDRVELLNGIVGREHDGTHRAAGADAEGGNDLQVGNFRNGGHRDQSHIGLPGAQRLRAEPGRTQQQPFAQAVARTGNTVYIRYRIEVRNGDYPGSRHHPYSVKIGGYSPGARRPSGLPGRTRALIRALFRNAKVTKKTALSPAFRIFSSTLGRLAARRKAKRTFLNECGNATKKLSLLQLPVRLRSRNKNTPAHGSDSYKT